MVIKLSCRIDGLKHWAKWRFQWKFIHSPIKIEIKNVKEFELPLFARVDGLK